MIGWIADALQLSWSYLYWNARKTRFRLQRGRVPCPCQSPSDSGRAMETGCEPSLLLDRPPRFRHVCPLLKTNTAGRWVCSVDASDVRPFWTRAFAVYAMAVLLLYLGTTGAIWGFLRSRQYPIRYYDVAWPGAWTHFHEIQSRYFAQKANRALVRHDTGEAIIALSVAYQLNPQNFGLGLTLARLTEVGQPALSDQVYAQLAREHPSRLAELLPSWYEALLWRADFNGIVGLTRQALAVDPAHRGAWLYGLLFALRREPDAKRLDELARDPRLVEVRPVFELDIQTRTGGASAREALLRPPAPHSPEYLNFYRPKRLIELGFAVDAVNMLSRPDVALPAHDLLALRLEAYATLGWDTVLRNEAMAAWSAAADPALPDVVAAELVRHPDPALLRSAFEAQKQHVPPKAEAAYRSWAGWLCAAGANGDFGRYEEARAEMKQISKSELRALGPLEAFFRGEGASSRIESYLPGVQPLPLDVTYALLERYYRPRGPQP